MVKNKGPHARREEKEMNTWREGGGEEREKEVHQCLFGN